MQHAEVLLVLAPAAEVDAPAQREVDRPGPPRAELVPAQAQVGVERTVARHLVDALRLARILDQVVDPQDGRLVAGEAAGRRLPGREKEQRQQERRGGEGGPYWLCASSS